MEIVTTVNNCRTCPYSISNVALHDDAFTSSPLLSYYVCQATGGPDFIYYKDAEIKIHQNCPKNNL